MNMRFEFEEEREKVTFTPKQITALKILNKKHVRGLLFGGPRAEANRYCSVVMPGCIAKPLSSILIYRF
jgi:hypothetical protein